MSTSMMHVSKRTIVLALAVFALLLGMVRDARAAARAAAERGPVVKNLVALSARPAAAQPAGPRPLTRKEVKKLTATAQSPEEHMTLARYYQAEAARTDAEGVSYEQAAAASRRAPAIKNFTAPGTAARYELLAKGFRQEAKADRERAASHEQMAVRAVAALR